MVGTILIICLIGWVMFYPQPETPEKIKILQDSLKQIEARYDRELLVIDSISANLLQKEWLIDSLYKSEKIIYITIERDENKYKALDRVSDSTDMLSDLRFLTGNTAD